MRPDAKGPPMTFESLAAGFHWPFEQVQLTAQHVTYNAQLLHAGVNRQHGFEAALKLIGVRPGAFLTVENDACAKRVLDRCFPDRVHHDDMNTVPLRTVQAVVERAPHATRWFVGGGFPCQPFSGLNSERRGWHDLRSDILGKLLNLCDEVLHAAEGAAVTRLLENVASMDTETCDEISSRVWPDESRCPLLVDLSDLAQARRPRILWVD